MADEGLFIITYYTDRQLDSLVHTQPEYLIKAREFLQGILLGIWKSVKVDGYLPYLQAILRI